MAKSLFNWKSQLKDDVRYYPLWIFGVVFRFFKELFCGHDEAPEIRVDKTGKKKRHYKYCRKCGKRIYID